MSKHDFLGSATTTISQITAGGGRGFKLPFRKDKGVGKVDTKDRGQLVFQDFQVIQTRRF